MVEFPVSGIKERRAHIFEREQHEHYVEPRWVTDRLFEVENFGPKGSLILDPCAGWCRIPAAVFAAGYMAIASDVVDRLKPGVGDGCKMDELGFIHKVRQLNILRNYNEEIYDWWRSAKSIISNPPFDDIHDVAQRCVALAQYKVALICPVRRLNAARWLEDLPLRRVWLLTPRPSMPSGSHISEGGYVGGGTVDFAWLVFEKGYVGVPELRWLRKDAGSRGA